MLRTEFMDALSTLLQQMQYLTDTRFFSLNTQGNWAYSISKKDRIYFYLVQSDSFCIQVKDVSRKAYAGDLIMIPHGHRHICHALNHHGSNAQPLDINVSDYDQGTVIITESSLVNAQLILVECQYDQELLSPLLLALPPILPEHEDMHESHFQSLEGAVNFIAAESAYERLGKMAMINMWANIVMIECLRTYIENLSEATDNWLMAMIDMNLSKALAVMHDKPNDNWTTHRLAQEAGMSRSGFTQRFKNIVGVPPLAYLTDYRLRPAARHLRLQQSSIAQIGEMVGYSSNSTFSQAFRRVYDMSPSEYRQQQRNKDQKMA